jgi:hypothetical protein
MKDQTNKHVWMAFYSPVISSRILSLTLAFPTVRKGIAMKHEKLEIVYTMLLWVSICGLAAVWGTTVVLT